MVLVAIKAGLGASGNNKTQNGRQKWDRAQVSWGVSDRAWHLLTELRPMSDRLAEFRSVGCHVSPPIGCEHRPSIDQKCQIRSQKTHNTYARHSCCPILLKPPGSCRSRSPGPKLGHLCAGFATRDEMPLGQCLRTFAFSQDEGLGGRLLHKVPYQRRASTSEANVVRKAARKWAPSARIGPVSCMSLGVSSHGEPGHFLVSSRAAAKQVLPGWPHKPRIHMDNGTAGTNRLHGKCVVRGSEVRKRGRHHKSCNTSVSPRDHAENGAGQQRPVHTPHGPHRAALGTKARTRCDERAWVGGKLETIHGGHGRCTRA